MNRSLFLEQCDLEAMNHICKSKPGYGGADCEFHSDHHHAVDPLAVWEKVI